VLKKLIRNNETLWWAHTLAILHGAQLAGLLDGTNKSPIEEILVKEQLEKIEEIDEVPNLAFEVWKAQEQHVLSYLLVFFSR
jgi:hypothetical protein